MKAMILNCLSCLILLVSIVPYNLAGATISDRTRFEETYLIDIASGQSQTTDAPPPIVTTEEISSTINAFDLGILPGVTPQLADTDPEATRMSAAENASTSTIAPNELGIRVDVEPIATQAIDGSDGTEIRSISADELGIAFGSEPSVGAVQFSQEEASEVMIDVADLGVVIDSNPINLVIQGDPLTNPSDEEFIETGILPGTVPQAGDIFLPRLFLPAIQTGGANINGDEEASSTLDPNSDTSADADVSVRQESLSPESIANGSVSMSSVRTTDRSNNTKTSFSAGENMRYGAYVANSTGATRTVNTVWSLATPCGSSTLYSGNVNTGAGTQYWTLDGTAASNCPGSYTFTVRVTYNGQTTSKSSTFSVSGGGSSGIPGITYTTRDGFHVFKIDMQSSNLSFETVMAKDATSGDTRDVEYVHEMVAHQPSSRNPVLAFNADYFGENHHGAEGLTLKNGVRLPNAGRNNGAEWVRSSLSISQNKIVRMGKQTDCIGTLDNPTKCSTWPFDSSRYYNTVGGAPLFVENGTRIGGSGSETPCRNEQFPDNKPGATYPGDIPDSYCTGSSKWTAAGVSSTGRYLIIVVSGESKTMDQAAQVLIAEGAVTAMKFDGGGSTQVWYKPNGTVVSGGRPVPNALMVFSSQ